MNSPAVRTTRLPLGATVSVAWSVSVISETVTLDETVTDASSINTKLLAAGTPLGLQLLAVDQFPPVAGPTHCLVRPSSLRIVPTACPSAIVTSWGLLRLTKNVSSDSLRVSPSTKTHTDPYRWPAWMVV